MLLQSYLSFLKESVSAIKRVKDLVDWGDILHRTIAKAYVMISKFYDEAFEDFLYLERKHKWIENLASRFIKGRRINQPGFDNVLEVFAELTGEWEERVGEELVKKELPKKVFKLGYVEGAKFALQKLGISAAFTVRGLPIEEAFISREPLLREILPKGVVDTVRDRIVHYYWNEGWHPDRIMKEIRDLIPQTYKNRAKTIARTETNYATSKGQYDTFIRNKITRKDLLIEPDACPLCWDAKASFDHAPINTAINNVFGEPSMFPPFHPNCYAEGTEVYTEDGWKPIERVKPKEMVLTLEPETQNLEWSKVKATIKYNANRIIEIKNKQNSFYLAVTEYHPFFGYKRVDRGKRGRELEPVWIEGVKNLNSEFRFYASSQWKGKDRKSIKIGKIELKTEDYCRLMGYFLSEGSVVRRGRRWQISIAQSKYLEEMWEDLKDLPVKSIWLGKDKIYISDQDLGKYLSQFGKASKRYVPEEIKELSPKYIRIFLDAFIMSDGSKRPVKWKGINFSEERIYSTSSKRLADDLGELIIKVGKSVSYYLMKRRGRKQKFKNGTFKIKKDIWIIRELTSRYRMFNRMQIEERRYGKDVYDLEVEKNHTILIRSKGKVFWGSNCRCAIIPVVEEIRTTPKPATGFVPAKTLTEARAFLKSLGVKSVRGYDHLPLDVANTINEVFAKLNEEYDLKIWFKNLTVREGGHGHYIFAVTTVAGEPRSFLWNKGFRSEIYREWIRKSAAEEISSGFLPRYIPVEKYFEFNVWHEVGHFSFAAVDIEMKEKWIRFFHKKPKEFWIEVAGELPYHYVYWPHQRPEEAFCQCFAAYRLGVLQDEEVRKRVKEIIDAMPKELKR